MGFFADIIHDLNRPSPARARPADQPRGPAVKDPGSDSQVGPESIPLSVEPPAGSSAPSDAGRSGDAADGEPTRSRETALPPGPEPYAGAADGQAVTPHIESIPVERIDTEPPAATDPPKRQEGEARNAALDASAGEGITDRSAAFSRTDGDGSFLRPDIGKDAAEKTPVESLWTTDRGEPNTAAPTAADPVPLQETIPPDSGLPQATPIAEPSRPRIESPAAGTAGSGPRVPADASLEPPVPETARVPQLQTEDPVPAHGFRREERSPAPVGVDSHGPWLQEMPPAREGRPSAADPEKRSMIRTPIVPVEKRTPEAPRVQIGVIEVVVTAPEPAKPVKRPAEPSPGGFASRHYLRNI